MQLLTLHYCLITIHPIHNKNRPHSRIASELGGDCRPPAGGRFVNYSVIVNICGDSCSRSGDGIILIDNFVLFKTLNINNFDLLNGVRNIKEKYSYSHKYRRI